MTNIAILIANSQYQYQRPLVCCHDDVLAIAELLKITEKYNDIEIIENNSANELKSKIRQVLDKHESVGELFFYFSGHGFQHEAEFFFCASDFDSKQPNKTGLSNTELHELLRPINSELVVKVIDACNSGTLLVKSEEVFSLQSKQGFKNLIQFASCLDSQTSLTGNPLSLFTEKFRSAILSKTDGVIFYTDIMFALRDEFLNREGQTPHFVSQGTGREQFCDNAKQFDALRAQIIAADPSLDEPDVLPSPPTLLNMLESTEAKLATAEVVQKFVGTFFDDIKRKLSADEFSDFFHFETIEHSAYKESTSEGFIIGILSKEVRPDNFVTATITRHRRQNSLGAMGVVAFASLGLLGDQGYTEVYDLELNCSMQRAQLKITLTPKYLSLKQLKLVISCAPSLERCYIFELATQHPLRDFGSYDSEGAEVIRRWYKLLWNESTDFITEKIVARIKEVAQNHLDDTFKRLNPE